MKHFLLVLINIIAKLLLTESFSDLQFDSLQEWENSLVKRSQNIVKAITLVDPAKNDYAFAIDAGSSHSEVIMFTWSGKIKETGLVRQIDNCEVLPGISSAGNDTDEMVDNLLDCVSTLMDKIPESHKGPFPILLGATAGMRVLKLTQNALSKKIFHAIADGFKDFNHNGRSLSVAYPRLLTGFEEGEFAWITANYLLKNIPPEDIIEQVDVPEPSAIGIIDMGGASAQIAFETEEQDANEIVTLFNHNYGVKAYSNLCFGSDQAAARYRFKLLLNREDERQTRIADPCMDKGPEVVIWGEDFLTNPCLKTVEPVSGINGSEYYTFHGDDGYYSGKCRENINSLTEWLDCDDVFTICFDSEENEIKDKTFYALSSYYYSLRVLPSISDEKDWFDSEETLLDEVDQWCSSPYSWRSQIAGKNYAQILCFKQNFIYYTLKNIYNFGENNWPNIHFTNGIEDSTLGWTLGFMLRKSNILPNVIAKKERVGIEIIRIYKRIKEVQVKAKNSNNQQSLIQLEEKLVDICEDLADKLKADILFDYEECGIDNDVQTNCCRARFYQF